MSPLISIITINYNNKAGLKKTLDSVMAQTFGGYEHIIIDGASSDGSVDVIKKALENKKYASHVSYWCSEKDGGIYPAMNKGLSFAKGRFILMLNSGDWLSSEVVLAGVEPYLLKEDNSVVYGAVDYFNGSDYVNTYSVGVDELFRGKNICHQACFVSKKIHDEIGVYDTAYKLWADYDFMLRSYSSSVSFVHIPIIVANCEKQGASNLNKDALKNDIKRIKKVYFPRENDLLLIIKKIFKLLVPELVFVIYRFFKGAVGRIFVRRW